MALIGFLAGAATGPKGFDPVSPSTNGLGMRFVPVPNLPVQFSIYQTRVKDFRTFVRETGYAHTRETVDPDSRMWSLDWDGNKQRGRSWEDPGFKQTDEDPVVGVTWYDARAFCEWLTLRERAAGRLPANWVYRLPTDHEWSVAAGLDEDPAETPIQKDAKIADRYPWGEGWPPPPGAGNYNGEEADNGHWPPYMPVIHGYNDGYPRTAPVGSFKPNRLGIYDLGGNVLEWCEEYYNATQRVMRGVSWRYTTVGEVSLETVNMLLSKRHYNLPASRYDYVGFRCVAGPSSP